ncbi:oligosaccharide flippase family protein [Proteus mirabilis]
MSLKKNIINLFGTQIISYLGPLLLLPYLSHILDTNYFGLYIFTLSIINFSSIITNFGFDISIPKKIAEGKNSKDELNTLNYHVNLIKLILSLFTLSGICVVIYYTNYYQNELSSIVLLLLSIFLIHSILLGYFKVLKNIYI